ncbi:MAG TPA: hypothetical protein VEO55_00805, partial [Candidatus Dormibacteraeota bacterium]|nr:hypothetical protein [Candidatus Dormibacteraeota bacterium]
SSKDAAKPRFLTQTTKREYSALGFTIPQGYLLSRSSTRAGREALAEYRLGPARLMRAQSMTSRKVSACLRDYSHRAPRRTRSSSNDFNFFKAQVAQAEAEPDRPEPHAGRGVIVTAKRGAIDRSLQNRGPQNVSADAHLNRVQHRDFREQPADSCVRIVETLLAEETFGSFRRQIAIPRMNFPRQPIDSERCLRRGHLQTVGTNFAALIQRQCALDFAPEHMRLVEVRNSAGEIREELWQAHSYRS